MTVVTGNDGDSIDRRVGQHRIDVGRCFGKTGLLPMNDAIDPAGGSNGMKLRPSCLEGGNQHA